jgi:hypothetical protein
MTEAAAKQSHISPEELTAARLQLHYAVQFIGAVGFNLAMSEADESQMAFEWQPEQKLFVGKPIAANQPFRVAIDPIGLELIILDSPNLQPTATFPLVGNTQNAGLDWLRAQVADRGVDADKVNWINYERGDFPDHAIAHGAIFQPGFEPELQTLVNYYALSDAILQKLAQDNQYASSVNIWPHHFDIALLISIPSKEEGKAKTIGVGMSPGDSSFNQPYWYVTPYPVRTMVTLPELPKRSFWNTKEWFGAVLTASRLEPDQDLSKQQQVEEFLNQAIELSMHLLEQE